MGKKKDEAKAPRIAVLVSGHSEAELRRFLAKYVKTGFGMAKAQWRLRYREAHALAVLSRPLRAGEDAGAVYGRHATAAVLVLACLKKGVPGSGREAARAWLKASGYAPVVELELEPGLPEFEAIDQGAEVVNFVNHNCPWRVDPVDDIEAYIEKNKPAWA